MQASVWSGHSCPLPLILVLVLILRLPGLRLDTASKSKATDRSVRPTLIEPITSFDWTLALGCGIVESLRKPALQPVPRSRRLHVVLVGGAANLLTPLFSIKI